MCERARGCACDVCHVHELRWAQEAHCVDHLAELLCQELFKLSVLGSVTSPYIISVTVVNGQ